MHKALPGLGLALAVLSVSFAAPLFRLADAPPLTASFWRLALAVLLLLPFAGPATRATWRAWDRRAWLLVGASGVALGIHFGLWVTSLFLTTVAASVSLVTLQAIFVALGGHWFLGDRLARAGRIGVALATVGALVISGGAASDWQASPRALLGDLLAILGGLGSAAYMLIGRRVRAKSGLIAYVLPVYVVAAVTVLVAAVGARQPVGLAWDSTFVYFVLLAGVPMLGGHTVANWCLRHLQAHVVATWILLEPVGAALLAWPLLDEAPTALTALGGLMVLAGAVATLRPGPRAMEAPHADAPGPSAESPGEP